MYRNSLCLKILLCDLAARNYAALFHGRTLHDTRVAKPEWDIEGQHEERQTSKISH